MSGFLSELLMRILDDPRFTNLDRELRGLDAEVDGNFRTLADYLFGMDAEGLFPSYVNDKPWDTGDVVIYDGKLWLQINQGSPSVVVGVLPGSNDAVWFRVRFSRFAHLPGTDTMLGKGTPNQVTVEEIKEGLGGCVRGYMRGVNAGIGDDTFVFTQMPLGFTIEFVRVGQMILDPIGNALDYTYTQVGTTGTLLLSNAIDSEMRVSLHGYCG